jgi:hypothetical protein
MTRFASVSSRNVSTTLRVRTTFRSMIGNARCASPRSRAARARRFSRPTPIGIRTKPTTKIAGRIM